MYAMVDDGVLPGIFRKTESRCFFVNLTIFAFVYSNLMFASTFDRILGFVMFLILLGW